MCSISFFSFPEMYLVILCLPSKQVCAMYTCEFVLTLSRHGIEPLERSYWIAQVDSSASHQHHWCAKWNLPIGWTSMHIAKYILPLYIKIWPLRMLVKPDYIGTIHQLLHFALNTLTVEWFFVCSACAHVWKQREKNDDVFISMQNDNGKYGNIVYGSMYTVHFNRQSIFHMCLYVWTYWLPQSQFDWMNWMCLCVCACAGNFN